MSEVTDPAGETVEYEYTLATRRLKQINNEDHTVGVPSSWKLYPTIGEGYAAGTGNTMLKVADMNARYVDEEGHTFKFDTDRFGNLIKFTDADNHVTFPDRSQSELPRCSNSNSADL